MGGIIIYVMEKPAIKLAGSGNNYTHNKRKQWNSYILTNAEGNVQ